MLRGWLIAGAIAVGIAGAPGAAQASPSTTTSPSPAPTTGASVYYPNCKAACADGVAPIYRGQPGYRAGLDRDGDGIACEVCH
ncbi:excalibur calcium-binding domain-containing protein [Mycobacterium sp. E1747]|uniref:excalibur calcium-binding domain-containing protein n=1 Tax=Mycobacterium sp. E1747 TaxID=1834128 RepID=UPI0009EE297C